MPNKYDIIIIGSGAGGGTMALELAKTGKKILIIERGEHLPREMDNWSPKAVFIDKKYRTKETWLDKDGKVLKPNTNYWVGGNTSFYGAALMRMKRRDFENVEHVDGISPAWPIKYDEWAPWYEKAEKLWQVHGKRGIDPNDEKTDPEYPYPAIIDDEGVAKLKEYFHNLGWHPSPLPLGIRRDDMHPFMSRCIRCKTCGGYPCFLSAKSDARTCVIEPALKYPNVTLLTSHKVERLNTDKTGQKVISVECLVGDDLVEFSADIFILAAGAINSAAILLKSADYKHPNGLANSSDMVGRNYMFHTTSAVISVLADEFKSDFPKTFAVNDFYFGDPDGSYNYPMGQIQLLEYMSGQTLEGQLSDYIPPEFIPDFLSDTLGKHMVAFLAMSEDLGMPDNRISVEEDGTIRLSYTPNNLESNKKLIKKLEKALSHFSLKTHVFFEPHFEIDQLLPLYGTAHQCGTLRFGTDAKTSVLDINCKAHDLDNLYVTDSSFFVSSSAVNPTLTIVANALRVANHLKESFNNERIA